MPANHSKYNKLEGKTIGGCALLAINPKFSKGPAPRPGPETEVDICDEAISYFKANVFFQTFEIKGNADRTLIYLTLYVSQCINRMTRCSSKDAVLKEMYQLSIESFPLPTDKGFPLANFYTELTSKRDSDELRAYLLQCRQEIGSRLAELVIDKTGKPSKWWLMFAKRKFLGKTLEAFGVQTR